MRIFRCSVAALLLSSASACIYVPTGAPLRAGDVVRAKVDSREWIEGRLVSRSHDSLIIARRDSTRFRALNDSVRRLERFDGRSGQVGAGIGAAVGAGIGFLGGYAVAKAGDDDLAPLVGAFTAGLAAIPGAIIGAVIGREQWVTVGRYSVSLTPIFQLRDATRVGFALRAPF